MQNILYQKHFQKLILQRAEKEMLTSMYGILTGHCIPVFIRFSFHVVRSIFAGLFDKNILIFILFLIDHDLLIQQRQVSLTVLI